MTFSESQSHNLALTVLLDSGRDLRASRFQVPEPLKMFPFCSEADLRDDEDADGAWRKVHQHRPDHHHQGRHLVDGLMVRG